MVSIPLIIHERLAEWARQVRPRVADWPVRLVETRSAGDLYSALRHEDFSLVLVDLAAHALERLEELSGVLPASADALVLVLNPRRTAGIEWAARELGATEVWSGPVPAPRLVERMRRWVSVAGQRAARDGWSTGSEPAPFTPDDLIRDARAARVFA